MNFFKSILSEDPDPSITENPQQSNSTDDEIDPNPNPNANADPSADFESNDTGGGGWNFGGLIKTLATRSESVLETYRRDLQEFGTGLKKETVIFREVASRAVKELPASIEVGASVAHGAIDGVIKSTAEIISHGKETLLSSSDVEPETPETSGLVSDSGRYSRFEARLSALQNDLNTFCDEPEDSEEYQKWKSGFVLEEKKEEVENLTGENGVLEGVYKRVVPNVVDNETFWYRYFYRVYKLTQQESVRANLVKRAISIEDEEELSWDVDDEDYEEDKNVKNLRDGESEKKEYVDPNSPDNAIGEKEPSGNESHDESSGAVDNTLIDKSLEHDVQKGTQTAAEVSKYSGFGDEDTNLKVEDHVKIEGGVVKEDEKEVITQGKEDPVSSSKEDEKEVKEDEKEVITQGKEDPVSSSKVVDASNVSSKQTVKEGKEDLVSSSKVVDASNVSSKQTVIAKEEEEEDEEMGWDEIEDIGSGDDKKESSTTPGEKQRSADVRERLSTAEIDEDLSWDIEDDD